MKRLQAPRHIGRGKVKSFRRIVRSLYGRAEWALRCISMLLVLVAFIDVGQAGRAALVEVSTFYEAPEDLPAMPGHLLKHDPFDRGLPDGSRAERILYTTTDLDGSIRVASGIVIVPAATLDRPLPVLLWAHGSTGVAQACAPSLLDDPLGSGAMPAQQQVIDNGWALVVPDYIGLGTAGPHPFLVGVPDARSSLDAVRAARQLDGLSLSDKTVVWGHSQGGAVALWAGIEATTYAPDIPLLGIAAIAPASDLPSLAAGLEDNPIGTLFGAFLLYAYSAVYADVVMEEYMAAEALGEIETVVGRCLSDPTTWLSIGALATGGAIIRRVPTDDPLGARLAENVPKMPSGVPTLIGQGEDDPLISPAAQTAFVTALCDAGQSVDYRIYDGRGHLDVVADDSPMVADLLSWTEARFAGQHQAPGCATNG